MIATTAGAPARVRKTLITAASASLMSGLVLGFAPTDAGATSLAALQQPAVTASPGTAELTSATHRRAQHAALIRLTTQHRHHTAQRRHRAKLAKLALAKRNRARSAAAEQIPASVAAQLQRLRHCESTDDYAANTGNGFYGAYQFDLQTWHSLGMAGAPHSAPATLQDRAAALLHARRGWQPWPSCSRALGLA
jgi:hypothetical protein